MQLMWRSHKRQKGQALNIFWYCNQFEDIFQEILGLPLKMEIDFSIDLVPGVASVSKTHYIMSTLELKELQMQQ
jgi:hypothetical protein